MVEFKIATAQSDFFECLKFFGFNFSEDLTMDKLAKAPCGLNAEYGTAYEGAMIAHAALVYNIATRLSKMFSNTFPVDETSLLKVCVMQHLSKAVMMVPTESDWEIKRGMLYHFNPTLKGCLKGGERSLLIATNAGVKFTDEEFEAMRILDKEGDELRNSKFQISPLARIVLDANDWAYAIEKEKKKA